MNDFAIRADSLSKLYRIGAVQPRYHTLRDTISDALTAPLRRLASVVNGQSASLSTDIIWALKNVSFEVRRGEVVGIIGCNGAGKTTLLKVLSRITEPTEGSAEIRGRVASLLEVGTGFHPELTGRENIYLNGAILGMKKAEIERKFEEIVAFAEVEKFVDTPVKHYSSGMHVRLAFAVAAHLEPEILLVDEVLAVGDSAFQKKCLGKMEDVALGGRTILFVSHNMMAVQRLCPKVMWLDGGRILEQGPASKIVSDYLRESLTGRTERFWPELGNAPGNERVRLRSAQVRPRSNSTITIKTPVELIFEYWNLKPGTFLNLSVHLFNEQGVLVLNTAPVAEPSWHGKPFQKGLYRSVCEVPGDLLNDGQYRVQLLVVKNQGEIVHREESLLVFDVLDDIHRRGEYHGKWPGVIRPDFHWQTELLETL